MIMGHVMMIVSCILIQVLRRYWLSWEREGGGIRASSLLNAVSFGDIPLQRASLLQSVTIKLFLRAPVADMKEEEEEEEEDGGASVKVRSEIDEYGAATRTRSL